MKKIIASLALGIMFSLMSQSWPVWAQDPRQTDGSLYPPLPAAALDQIWHGKETQPLWMNIPAGSLNMDLDPVPGNSFFLGALAQGLREGADESEYYLSEEEKEALLRGEPQDTSCVMGVRYSFSEFDIGHFCRSFFHFLGGGSTRPQKEDEGFRFYLD